MEVEDDSQVGITMKFNKSGRRNSSCAEVTYFDRKDVPPNSASKRKASIDFDMIKEFNFEDELIK